MKIAAIIFDLDGTVLDNEALWEGVFRRVADKRQIPIHKSQKWMHEPGIGLRPNWRKYVREEEGVEELTRETWKLYKEKTEDLKEVQMMEGVVELVEWAKEKGWLTALATSTEWHVVEKELEILGLYLAFDVTTTGEEVMELKPSPQIYLWTAQKLGVDPADCVVVEDAIAGVKSAVSAGMKVIGLTSEYADEKMLKKTGVKWVVDNLTEIVLLLAGHAEGKISKTQKL